MFHGLKLLIVFLPFLLFFIWRYHSCQGACTWMLGRNREKCKILTGKVQCYWIGPTLQTEDLQDEALSQYFYWTNKNETFTLFFNCDGTLGFDQKSDLWAVLDMNFLVLFVLPLEMPNFNIVWIKKKMRTNKMHVM